MPYDKPILTDDGSFEQSPYGGVVMVNVATIANALINANANAVANINFNANANINTNANFTAK